MGTAGQTNYGEIDFYNGKNGRVGKFDSTGLTVDEKLFVTKVFHLGNYMWATLPTATAGAIAYCTNGRKVGEVAGAGTGVPVYYSNSIWKVFGTDATVTS